MVDNAGMKHAQARKKSVDEVDRAIAETRARQTVLDKYRHEVAALVEEDLAARRARRAA